jgi:hypothetical protein
MSSVNRVSGIPTEGKRLIIVAAVDHVLHFRIFGGDGKMVVDTDEKRLIEEAAQIGAFRGGLRMQLKDLWPPHELTENEKGQVISAVTWIVSPTRQGKPLLSWRVAILPYIEQNNLYKKFKLDEPWDSPHNKPLLEEMPPVYACPSTATQRPFSTTYRAVVGKDTVIQAERGVQIADIIDGITNTLMIVEAKEAVPWTKPDELRFDPAESNNPVIGIGSPHTDWCNVVDAAGQTFRLHKDVVPETLRDLMTINGAYTGEEERKRNDGWAKHLKP